MDNRIQFSKIKLIGVILTIALYNYISDCPKLNYNIVKYSILDMILYNINFGRCKKMNLMYLSLINFEKKNLSGIIKKLMIKVKSLKNIFQNFIKPI